ncbi:D-alanine--D-alanine ligase family protein [Nitrospira sp.]|uniref:D-alanine--D-alanine ligase family protein n=2 Tax=unclassified Nitrospira TaxID=2652172 RepID=UPI003FCD6FFE
MRKLRVMALMHQDLVPPEDVEHADLAEVEWKTEFDVVSTLRDLGHEVMAVGVRDDLSVIDNLVTDWKPHIAFNLLEEFNGNPEFDQNVVSYLELLGVPYTGCNPKGLVLTRDKGWSKKIMAYHGIRCPEFVVYPLGRGIKWAEDFPFPVIVKSISEEASLGISQASIVHDEEKLKERVEFVHQSVGTSVIVERYIEGRELYVGVLGNRRLQALPVWELHLKNLPPDALPIATARVKWSTKYQKKYGIQSGEVEGLHPKLVRHIQQTAKRVFHILGLNGYARMDFRLDPKEHLYILEANPNAQLAYGEDLAESAERAGISYEALIQRILNIGLSWKPESQR